MSQSNILINEHRQPCLTDFGISLLLQTAVPSTTGAASTGTPGWMAPEILDPDHLFYESGHPTLKSDIYSLAMVWWEVRCFFDHLYIMTHSTKDLLWETPLRSRPQQVHDPQPCRQGPKAGSTFERGRTWLVRRSVESHRAVLGPDAEQTPVLRRDNLGTNGAYCPVGRGVRLGRRGQFGIGRRP